MARKSKSKSEYNIWRVLVVFIEGIFNLFNTNKIYPAFGLLLIYIMGLIVWRLPNEDLADIIKILVNEFIVNKGSLIAIIIITNFGWAYLLKRTTKLYQNEIDRLSNIRSKLLHKSEDKSIIKHRSSEEDCKESYIIPDANDKKEES